MGSSISVKNLSAGYGSVKILSNVSMEVRDGETVALLGTNGNGKSTLIKCITGQLRPTSGSVTAQFGSQSVELSGLAAEEVVDLGIALVPEGRRLFPKLTVEENLLLGAYRPEARRRQPDSLAFCYETFPRLLERRQQLAGSMSGGEQQMLAIGRALMTCPTILIVDEPSVGLSPALVMRTIEMIGGLKEKLGLTVLMAEQNFEQTIRIANRGYVMVHGEIALTADRPEELINSDLVRKLYLGFDDQDLLGPDEP